MVDVRKQRADKRQNQAVRVGWRSGVQGRNDHPSCEAGDRVELGHRAGNIARDARGTTRCNGGWRQVDGQV